MMFKAVLLCASALLVQSITGQCVRRVSVPSCGCSSGSSSLSSGSCGLSSSSIAAPSSGGPLIVTSVGPIVPTGIAVASDLALGGDLSVSGQLPFLSAVAFDGCFPTSGSGSVCYGCGDSNNVGITQEQGSRSGRNAASASGLTSALLGCGCN